MKNASGKSSYENKPLVPEKSIDFVGAFFNDVCLAANDVGYAGVDASLMMCASHVLLQTSHHIEQSEIHH